jgi:hypothetical protein
MGGSGKFSGELESHVRYHQAFDRSVIRSLLPADHSDTAGWLGALIDLPVGTGE